MKNILIIDNQYLQYNLIARKLEGHNVFPLDDDFPKLMDWVRIFLNNRYKGDRRQACFTLLEQYAWSNKIDLFIIDYKLSGSHDGKTGISIAAALMASRFKGFPIIFLSRTPEKSHEVQRELTDNPDITNYVWVDKGYAGVSLSEDFYFKKYILDEFKRLHQPSEAETYLNKITELKKVQHMDPIMKDLFDLENRLKGQSAVPGNIKIAIDELYVYITSSVSETTLADIIKKYKQ